MNLIKIINLKLTMIPTKDYDIIFENFLNNELEVLYKDLIQFFSTNDGLSNTHNLALFLAKLNFKTEELKALKPFDYWHPYDEFIQELIKLFPYKQHEDKYKSSKVKNFFKYDLASIKEKFNNAIFPYNFNNKLFNAPPIKILELLAKYFAIQDFILKATTVKLLDRDRPQKVAERIKNNRGVIIQENNVQQTEGNYVTFQQVLIMHYIFSALDLNEDLVGIKSTKNSIIEILTGKSIENIKKFMVNPLNYKTTKNTIDDIENIKDLLLDLGNKKIQKSIEEDIYSLKLKMKN